MPVTAATTSGGIHRGQLRECKEYADQNGITVVRTYIDRALSAKTDSARSSSRSHTAQSAVTINVAPANAAAKRLAV